MEASLLRPATVPGVCNGEYAGEEVWRSREQKSLNVGIPKGLDDGREEVWEVVVLTRDSQHVLAHDCVSGTYT